MFIPDAASTIAPALTFRGLIANVDAREVHSEELWQMTRRGIPEQTDWAILWYGPNRNLSIRYPDDVPEWNTEWGEEEEWQSAALFISSAAAMQKLYAELISMPYATEDIRRRLALHLTCTRVAVFSDFVWWHLFKQLEQKGLLYNDD